MGPTQIPGQEVDLHMEGWKELLVVLYDDDLPGPLYLSVTCLWCSCFFLFSFFCLRHYIQTSFYSRGGFCSLSPFTFPNNPRSYLLFPSTFLIQLWRNLRSTFSVVIIVTMSVQFTAESYFLHTFLFPPTKLTILLLF